MAMRNAGDGAAKAALSLAFLLAAIPVTAAERGVSVTDFDRVRVVGNARVEITTATATTAKVSGDQGSVDRTVVEVQGRQLVIRPNRAGWGSLAGDARPATVRITTPNLTTVSVSGAATVTVARLKGMRVGAAVEGAGSVRIARVEADRADLVVLGAGTVIASGTAKSVLASARGAGTIDATALAADDLKVVSESAGSVALSARRAADVTMTGAGSVTVSGRPACTVRNLGAGSVSCGSDQAERR
jgi:Putative auto-transporter adhesin, head GIN domain